jgi:hypothetical protein
MAAPLQPVRHGLLLFGAQPLYYAHPGVVYDVLKRLLKPASRHASQPGDFRHDFRHRPPLVGERHLPVGNGDGQAQVAAVVFVEVDHVVILQTACLSLGPVRTDSTSLTFSRQYIV